MKNTNHNPQSFPPLYIRLPPEMNAWLRDRAKENARTLKAELIVILEAERTFGG